MPPAPPRCGQAAHIHKTLGAFFNDLLHGVFHFEGKIWRTLPLLAWQEPAALLPMSALTGLIVWRHRGNLRDLLAGRERHF